MERYTKGSHTLYHHRYHLVWITKYRYRVLRGELQRRVRTIIAQVAEELGVKILNGVVSSDHIHLFVSIPTTPTRERIYQTGEGAEFKESATGVSRVEEKVLGTSLLSERLL